MGSLGVEEEKEGESYLQGINPKSEGELEGQHNDHN